MKIIEIKVSEKSVFSDYNDKDVHSLDEETLRAVLIELKNITQHISEMVAEKSKDSTKLDVEEARVITKHIKDKNYEKAIKAHMFFLNSSTEEATSYVENVKEKLEL